MTCCSIKHNNNKIISLPDRAARYQLHESQLLVDRKTTARHTCHSQFAITADSNVLICQQFYTLHKTCSLHFSETSCAGVATIFTICLRPSRPSVGAEAPCAAEQTAPDRTVAVGSHGDRCKFLMRKRRAE